MKILLIQGPNINMLGRREPHIYGHMSMQSIHEQLNLAAKDAGAQIECFQSNFEGEIVDKIQESIESEIDGLIINPAAFTHSSLAIRDALACLEIPSIEIHISNLARREKERQISVTAQAVTGVISGFGPFGYHIALMSLLQMIAQIRAQNEAINAQNQAN